MAAIIVVNALHNNFQSICATNDGSQIQFAVNGNNLMINRWNASNDATGFAPVAGAPYFVAMTTDNVTNTSIVWTRMDTGAIQFFRATPASAVNGTTLDFSIGESTTSGVRSDIRIAAVMYSQAVNSFDKMMQWAADPGSFWIPSSDQIFVGVQAPVAPPETSTSMDIYRVRDGGWQW